MGKQIKSLGTIIILLTIIWEGIFIGCGSSNSGDYNPISSSISQEETSPKIFMSPATYASKKGTFFLSSTNSSFIAGTPEENSIKEGSSISLIEKEKSPLDGIDDISASNSSRIYRLVATCSNEKGKEIEITKLEKPIKITINSTFPSNSKEFYLATKELSEKNWKYLKLTNTLGNNYVLASSRLAAAEESNFSFNLETYNLGEEFTILAVPQNVPLTSPLAASNFNVDSIGYSVSLPYLDLKINDEGQIVYNSDLTINSCVNTNSWDFSKVSIKTTLTFFTNNSQKITGLRVSGASEQLANESVSINTSGAGSKYVHTITFNDYPSPETMGQTATYTFALKLRNHLFKDFPETFRIESTITDIRTGTQFKVEDQIAQDRVLSYFEPVSPVPGATKQPLNTSLVMHYIGHDIASISVICTTNDAQSTIKGHLSIAPDQNLLVFNPTTDWPENKPITAKVTAYCCKIHGANGTKSLTFTFDTATDPIEPIEPVYAITTISLIEPAQVTDVVADTAIRLKFSDSIKWKNLYHSYVKLTSNGVAVPTNLPTYDEGSNILTINPKTPLAYNCHYEIEFLELLDTFMKKKVIGKKFEFETADGFHSTATIVDGVAQTKGDKYYLKPVFTIDFGKSICDPADNDNPKLSQALNAIKIYENDQLIDEDCPKKTWIASYTKLELSFNYPLQPSSNYSIQMGTGITDFENLSYKPFEPKSFTTLPTIGNSLLEPATLTDVALNTNVVIQFSENYNWVATFSDRINLFLGKTEIEGTKIYNPANQTFIFNPKNDLINNATYTFLIGPDMRDPISLQELAKGYYSFSTPVVITPPDEPPPPPILDLITSTITTPNTNTNVAPDTKIVVSFSKEITWNGTNDEKRLFKFTRGYFDISDTLQNIEYNNTTKEITITASQLLYNASYTIKLLEDLTNETTGEKVASTTFTFTTADSIHNTAEVTLAPDSNVGGLAILEPTLKIDFKKPVQDIYAAEKALEIWRGDTKMTGYRRRWATDLSKLDIYYTSTLVPNCKHTIKMLQSIKDFQGGIIEPFTDYDFTTMPNIEPSLIKPTTTTEVDVATNLVIKFSNSISWTENQDASKIKFQLGIQDIPIESYVYNDAEKTLTMNLFNNLTHNSTYYVRISNGLVNNQTRQEVATLTFSFATGDGSREKATAGLTTASIVGTKSILKPTINVFFPKMLLPADLTKAQNAIRLYNEGKEITTLQKTWRDSYTRLEITFSQPLAHSENYVLTMDEGIKDLDGIYFIPFDPYEFTTLDKIRPILQTPVTNSGVMPDTAIEIKFSEPITWSNFYIPYVFLRTGSYNVLVNNYTYDESTNVLRLEPNKPLYYNTDYQIVVKDGLKNEETNQTNYMATFDFTTAIGTQVTATLTRFANDEVGDLYTVSPTFEVDFGKTVLDPEEALNAIQIRDRNNVPFLSTKKKWIVKNSKALITTSLLKPNTEYKIEMNDNIPDIEGSPIITFTPFSFTTTENGTGSEKDPFHVYTASQLDRIRDLPDAAYILKKDIDLSDFIANNYPGEKGWLPIGDANNTFKGIFDGNGHKISGLMTNRPTKDSIGLFGHIADATIKNLILSNGKVEGEDSCGAIVGYAFHSTITNCINESVVASGTSYIGGICGSLYSTYLTKCRNYADVYASNEFAGGIVGWTKQNSKIQCCQNSGRISATNNYVGGIVGSNYGIIENSLSQGIMAGREYVGGIAGNNMISGRIDRTIAVGSIIATNFAAKNSGGICGYCDITAKITNSVITNNTIVDSFPCDNAEQSVGNYIESSNKGYNYFFSSIAELNKAILKASSWADQKVWSSDIWTLSSSALPALNF